MRTIAPEILEKINQTIQTRDNGSSFHNYIWIKRPTTELMDGRFIEKLSYQNEAENAVDFDIAVCHPMKGYIDTTLFESHITGGDEQKLQIAEIQIDSKISKKPMEPDAGWVDKGTRAIIATVNSPNAGPHSAAMMIHEEIDASINTSRLTFTLWTSATSPTHSYTGKFYFGAARRGNTASLTVDGDGIASFNSIYEAAYYANITSADGAEYQIVGMGSNPSQWTTEIRHDKDGTKTVRINLSGRFYNVNGQYYDAVWDAEHVLEPISMSGGDWPIAKQVIHPDPIEYSGNPIACAVAFDGVMPKDDGGYVQFVTEEYPWVFCVYDDGKLMAKQINSNRAVDVLAESGGTDVSAIRAPWTDSGEHDHGLVCFYILSGEIYYRQYIRGVWYDQVQVDILPEGMQWVELAAFRTWDYRVGFHAKNTNGEIYEVFTKFMGMGDQGAEHVSVHVDASGDLKTVRYKAGYDDTHVETTANVEGAVLYAFTALPVSAANVYRDGNYGKFVALTMSHAQSNVLATTKNFFYLTDSDGRDYTCVGVEYANEDHRILMLEFTDFNQSHGAEKMTLEYRVGLVSNGLMSPAVRTESFTVDFVPKGLIDPVVESPEPVDIWNE